MPFIRNTRKALAAVLGFMLMALSAHGYARGKQDLDAEVRRLCAIDGGLHVYEKVALPADKFTASNRIAFQIPFCEYAKPADEYCLDTREREYIKRGDPEMFRSAFKLVRRNDSKILAQNVTYTRRGGDGLLGLVAHPSAFGCPDLRTTPSVTSAFVKENQ